VPYRGVLGSEFATVVELEPLEVSDFNRPQQTSTDIHKVL
jgi:hypothetical protein